MPPVRQPIWGNLLTKVGSGLRALIPYGRRPATKSVCQGRVMGTIYDVTVLHVPTSIGVEALSNVVRAEPDRVEALMSTYRADSDVGRINAATHGDWVAVAAETVALIEQALCIGRLSDGAYDITAGPLVNLWGFGPGARTREIPTDDQIEAAWRHVGLDLIEVRAEPPAVRKRDPLARIDLASIAKGYGVDCTATVLDRLGLRDYCISIGGEVRTRGRNDRGLPWQIGVDSPRPGVNEPYCVIPLSGQALATSGDYRIFTEVEGRRYSHTIDPRTGRPITNGVTSVSVVHDSCALADAWATALMVAGSEAGFELAVGEGLAAMLLVREGETIREKSTPGMSGYRRA